MKVGNVDNETTTLLVHYHFPDGIHVDPMSHLLRQRERQNFVKRISAKKRRKMEKIELSLLGVHRDLRSRGRCACELQMLLH